MTKSFEKIATSSYHGVDFSSSSVDNHMSDDSNSETPVLDLSFRKKSPSPGPMSDNGKDSSFTSVSSPHDSPCPESHQETNNNDKKHIDGHRYYHMDQDLPKIHSYHIDHRSIEESTALFSTSNNERKTPFDNRAHTLTPPSDAESPRKNRIHTSYDNTSLSISETMVQPPYKPLVTMGIPMPLPISLPILAPLLPQNNSTSPGLQIPSSLSPQESPQSASATEDSKKTPRPFKAYPKDPMSISMGPDMMFDQDMKKAYTDFRNRMLDSVKKSNEGTNIKMRRISKSPIMPTSALDEKDSAYWERRRKNNEAAKRSRDARRAKEDEIAIRAAFLEQEYIRLKCENAVLKDENTKIKCMLYGC